MDVRIETFASTTYLISPYNPDLPARAKAIGGRWDAGRKAWKFDSRDEDRVRDLARAIYGTDGSPADDGDLVTVRVRLADYEVNDHYRKEPVARFAGRMIAERTGRDKPVHLAPGVVLIEGHLPSSGGSMRYPLIEAGDDVILEIRDLPRTALAVEDENRYEIVGEIIDVEALTAERARLLARVAEIDALLVCSVCGTKNGEVGETLRRWNDDPETGMPRMLCGICENRYVKPQGEKS